MSLHRLNLQSAISKLVRRVPNVFFFDEEARNLLPEYTIEELSVNVPAALENLCEVAELNIKALILAVKSGETASISTMKHKSNAALQSKFRQAWRQSHIRVSLELHDGKLIIQIVNENYDYTDFAERSDGLRQFVALQAFASCNWANSPILLIDEAEQRLHYDAQADLVQMLARQTVSPKVIYTTHSAGCLPEDLGNGVRIVKETKDDVTLSTIQNKFWADNQNGFTAMLFGMGASTLAFFPTRHAVMVEGPADMLLYPSMFRESTGLAALGFQFVPGLAVNQLAFGPEMLGSESGVLYLVDGDRGGLKLKADIIKVGVSENKIFVLKNSDNSAVELEDFIDENLLVEGCNNILERYSKRDDRVSVSGLQSKNRMASLERSYNQASGQTLSKADLAYEILDILLNNPARKMLDQRRKRAFGIIVNRIEKSFLDQAGSQSSADV